MNKAHFEILGITVPSGRYQYHDEGYVDSIPDATKRINKLYGFDNSNYDAIKYRNAIGMHCGRGFNSHIFYLQRPTRILDIQNRSHEETHALDFIEQLDALADKLLEEQHVRINFKEVDDQEVRAQLGSLYALHARGLSLWRLWGVYATDTFSTAKKIYQQSKQPQKRFFIF
jgi:hypothetical protein